MAQVVIKVEIPDEFEIPENLKRDDLLTDQFIGNIVKDHPYTIEVRNCKEEKNIGKMIYVLTRYFNNHTRYLPILFPAEIVDVEITESWKDNRLINKKEYVVQGDCYFPSWDKGWYFEKRPLILNVSTNENIGPWFFNKEDCKIDHFDSEGCCYVEKEPIYFKENENEAKDKKGTD